MTDKEELYYLVREYLKGNYKPHIFTDLFSIKFDQNTEYPQLSDIEYQAFEELSIITGRYSQYESDLKNYPNVFYSDIDVWKKAKETMEILNEVNSK